MRTLLLLNERNRRNRRSKPISGEFFVAIRLGGQSHGKLSAIRAIRRVTDGTIDEGCGGILM